MSISQLKKIYTHFQTEFDVAPRILEELKKKILLELKSSKSGFLEIDGKQWSKSELLQLLNREVSVRTFDFYKLKEAHPKLRLLKRPQQITTPCGSSFSELSPDILQDIRTYCSEHYGKLFSIEIRKNLRALDFVNARIKLTYIDLFDAVGRETILLEIQSCVIQMIRYEEDYYKSVAFILEHNYYLFLYDLGRMDPLFLNEQYIASEPWLNKMSNHQKKEFYYFQVQLPYLPRDLEQIKHLAFQNSSLIMNAINSKFPTPSKHLLQLLVVIGVLILFVFYLHFFFSGSPRLSKESHDEKPQQQEETQPSKLPVKSLQIETKDSTQLIDRNENNTIFEGLQK